MRVKICGLHPLRDVKLCIDLGVNFLGFVFYEKSPRNLNLNDIQRVIFTHGHSDHDGTAHEFSSLYKTEIWAHKTYSPLKKYKIWEIQDRESSVLQKQIMRISSILISDSELNRASAT